MYRLPCRRSLLIGWSQDHKSKSYDLVEVSEYFQWRPLQRENNLYLQQLQTQSHRDFLF